MTMIGMVIVLSGCETTASRPYAASTDNVLKLQGLMSQSNTKVQLEDFSESSDIGSLNCRLNGPIDVSPGKTKAAYIQEAFKTELFMAQAYAVDADTKIYGSLDSLEFSSVSPAKWEIGFTLSSDKSEGYSVNTTYPFKTSFSAYSACKNVADAFGPAVQNLIKELINHPDFASLLGQ